jgi:hypothetical protein
LLRRIPAVNWAFTRLAPLPHSGGIDVAPVNANGLTAAISETADFNPVVGTDRLPAALPAIEPIVEREASVSSIDVETEPVPEPVSASIPSAELVTNAETVVAEESFLDVQPPSMDAPEVSIDDEVCPCNLDNVGPAIVEAPCIVLVDAGVSPVEIEPVIANDPAPAAAIETEVSPASPPIAATRIEPPLALVPPAPEIRSAPKARATATEPSDRATLIRRRWTETGIRMWNPRLHGTGEATLNIQGRVELLPPAPGETMPRYDKLEFRMLGGQVVCEGVIVEAPAQASHRSFTRLAEPGKSDRVREPARQRQAALA